MDLKQKVRSLVVGKYANWNPEVAMRYLFMLPYLEDNITEIGSGDMGIVPYLRRTVVGVDPSATSAAHANLLPVRASATQLPFRDSSQSTVLCTDVLEHIHPEHRRAAIYELVRIACSRLVIAVPSGAAAERHDREISAYFERKRGYVHPFFEEHLAYPLPVEEDLVAWIKEASPGAAITSRRNASIAVRRPLMRLWARGKRLDVVIQILLNRAHPLLRRANFGSCYRLVLIVDLQT